MSAIAHVAIIAVASFSLGASVTPPRPIGVVIGITSFASAASSSARENSVVETLPDPMKIEEPKPQPEEIAAHPVRVPPPPEVTPKSVAKRSEAAASLGSQSSAGAQVDRMPEKDASNPAPPYPAEAAKNGWEGRVVLRVMVLRDGKVGDVSVHRSSGHDVLDRAAMDTVRNRWLFIPGRRGETPIDYAIGVPINFRLDLAATP